MNTMYTEHKQPQGSIGTGIRVGVDSESVQAARDAVMAILDSRADARTKRAAIKAMGKMCSVNSCVVTNCVVTNSPVYKTEELFNDDAPPNDDDHDTGPTDGEK